MKLRCKTDKTLYMFNSTTCEFCSHDIPDDIVHALCQCEYSTKFLTDIFSLIDRQNDYVNTVQIADFLLGVDNPALNVIFLKKYIMKVRSYKNTFSLNNAMNQIYRRIMLENKVVKSELFSCKWQSYHHIVNQAQVHWAINSELW